MNIELSILMNGMIERLLFRGNFRCLQVVIKCIKDLNSSKERSEEVEDF